MARRDRVLCVFTTGQAWQFKPYKWTEPKDLFRNGESRRHQVNSSSEFHPTILLIPVSCRHHTVLGVYFHLSTEPQHPATKEWNVKPFKVGHQSLLFRPFQL